MASTTPPPGPHFTQQTTSPPTISPQANDTEGQAEDETEMPITMAASVVLDHLPRDAHEALSQAGKLTQDKITLHFRPGPQTPSLKQSRYKMSSSLNFDSVLRFLRRKLGLQDHEGLFCYVNQVFAPAADEGVGNLWRCFKVGDELVVSYCVVQSFG